MSNAETNLFDLLATNDTDEDRAFAANSTAAISAAATRSAAYAAAHDMRVENLAIAGARRASWSKYF